MFSLTDIAFFTLDDEITLYGNKSVEQIIEMTQSKGVNEIIIKRGASPCIIAIDERCIEVEASIVENVIDTTAAGDSFSAAYLASRIKRDTPEKSAHNAHLLAGTVIQYHGAIIPKNVWPKM